MVDSASSTSVTSEPWLDKQGIEPRALTPDDFGKLLRADYVRMAQVVKASGAKVE